MLQRTRGTRLGHGGRVEHSERTTRGGMLVRTTSLPGVDMKVDSEDTKWSRIPSGGAVGRRNPQNILREV